LPRQHAGAAQEEIARRQVQKARAQRRSVPQAGVQQAPAAVSAAAELSGAGVWVQDQFAAPSQIHALLDCVQARKLKGEFAPARVGGRAALQRREEIRGDFTCWLGDPLYPAERGLLDQLEELRLELNREAFLGLFDLELQYAWYPPGAGYSRHVDQPQGTTQRLVSMVLYLNVDWEPVAGGALRIYDAAEQMRDIEPIAGRLICFLTPGREHAVLPATRDRFSISGWFRGRD
jgi:SM-20-related protein